MGGANRAWGLYSVGKGAGMGVSGANRARGLYWRSKALGHTFSVFYPGWLEDGAIPMVEHR